jgi:hypothetical protein
MKIKKFVVRLSRVGTHAPEYVQRIDRTPIHTTTNRKLALTNGKIYSRRRCGVRPKLAVQTRVTVRGGSRLGWPIQQDYRGSAYIRFLHGRWQVIEAIFHSQRLTSVR